MSIETIEALKKIGDVNLLSDDEARELYAQIKPGTFARLVNPDAARQEIKKEILKTAGVNINGGIIVINGIESMKLPELG